MVTCGASTAGSQQCAPGTCSSVRFLFGSPFTSFCHNHVRQCNKNTSFSNVTKSPLSSMKKTTAGLHAPFLFYSSIILFSVIDFLILVVVF